MLLVHRSSQRIGILKHQEVVRDRSLRCIRDVESRREARRTAARAHKHMFAVAQATVSRLALSLTLDAMVGEGRKFAVDKFLRDQSRPK